jgi:hypothetical protein
LSADRVARLSDNLVSKIAVRNHADQFFFEIIRDDRDRADTFPPHYPGGLADTIVGRTTYRIFRHDFSTLHVLSFSFDGSEMPPSPAAKLLVCRG